MAAAFYVLTAVLIFAIYVNGIWPVIVASQAQMSKDRVFVMYAASLIKTFEEKLGPTFQEKTGYIYEGEARGSVQYSRLFWSKVNWMQLQHINMKLCQEGFHILHYHLKLT